MPGHSYQCRISNLLKYFALNLKCCIHEVQVSIKNQYVDYIIMALVQKPYLVASYLNQNFTEISISRDNSTIFIDVK